jgi:hypothetical protein
MVGYYHDNIRFTDYYTPRNLLFVKFTITHTYSGTDNWLKASLTMQQLGHPVTVSKVIPISHNRGPEHYLLLKEWNPV